MRIDGHQHYWEPARDDYGWLMPDKGILYRDYLPQHLKPHLDEHRMARTIVVQAAPTVEETVYMLGLSERDPSIAGVVGWLDFEAPTFAEIFEKLRANPKFVGVRPMIQDLPEDWLLRPQVVAHMKLLEAEGFPVDLQLRPFLMDAAAALLEQVPKLRAVVDHIAKPEPGEPVDQWALRMKRLADYPNVYCKISGLVPEVYGAAWSAEQIKPYVSAVLACFGPERVFFGSDWPVCLLSATYDQVVSLAESLLPDEWTEAQRDGFWGGNAAAFYRLSADNA